MKLRHILSIVLLCIFSSTTFSQGFWQQTGGPGSGVSIQAFGKGKGGVVYAATRTTFYHSSDNGANWSASSKTFDITTDDAIAVDSNGNVYVADAANIYKSVDNGDTWTPISTSISGTTFYGITISNKDYLFVGTYDKGVYRSTNYGDSWTAFKSGLPELPGIGDLYSIYRIASVSSTVFAMTQGGLARSTDDGASWSIVGELVLPLGLTTSLASTPSGKIFLATSSGLYSSTDNGDNWASIKGKNGLNTGSSRLVATDNGSAVLMSAGGGLWLSTDDGANWNEARKSSSDNSDLALCMIGSAQHLFEGTDRGGISYSNDAAVSWSSRNFGILKSSVTTLAVNRAGYLYAQADQDVFISSNYGDTWRAFDTLLFNKLVRSITVSSSGMMFAAGYGAGLFTSVNNGQTWVSIVGTMSGTNKANLSALTATETGAVFAGGDNGVVYRTTNDGVNWSIKRNGITQSPITILTAKKGGTVFAVNADGVFRTVNNGDSWDTLTTAPTSVTSMAIDSAGTVYVGHSGGVSYSSNNGNSFTAASSVSNAIGIAVNSVGTVYVLGSAGLYSSKDNGGSWKLEDAGLNSLAPTYLVCDKTNRLYAGTYSNGVYRSGQTAPSSIFSHSHSVAATATFGENYPNPFQKTTNITYSVAKPSFVELDILDLHGKFIINLEKRFMIEGDYAALLDAHSLGLSSGVYLCRLQSNGVSVVKTISYQRN